MEHTDASKLSKEIIVAVLKGEMNPSEFVDRTQPDTFDVYAALYEMKSTAQEYERIANSIKDTLDCTIPYVNGEAGRWNSLGNLQSEAQRIETLAAVFTLRCDYARKAVFNHLMSAKGEQ